MKKIVNYKYSLLALLSLTMVFIACNDDVEDLGKKEKPVLTANGPTSITVPEGDDAVLKFKLNKAINEPVQYRLVILNDSDATDQDDYIIPGCRSNDPDCVAIEENGGPVGYIFEIPAYTTEYEVNIATIFDDFNEAPETLKLKVVSNRTLLGVVDELYYTVTINNSVSDDLNIRLNWDGTFTSAGNEVDNCDLDMDLELYDSGLNLIDFSYNDCPESLVLDTSSLANGTYYLVASLWSTSGYSETVNVPARINFLKPGSASNQTYDISAQFPMQDGGLEDGNSNAQRVYTIVKLGTQYTITDQNTSTVVFQGRHINIPSGRAKKSKR